MTIELNLKQVEYLITLLSESELVPVGLDRREFLITLKEAVKIETVIQQDEIDKLLQRVKSNGIDDIEFIKKLSSAKETINSESEKKRDKYFDEEGNIKK